MGEKNSKNATLFLKRKLKWYEKIWSFITRQEIEEYYIIGPLKDIEINSEE